MANLCDFKMQLTFDTPEQAKAFAEKLLPDRSVDGVQMPGGKTLDCPYTDVKDNRVVAGGSVRWSFTNYEFVNMLRAIDKDAGLSTAVTFQREDGNLHCGQQCWDRNDPEKIGVKFLSDDEYPKWEEPDDMTNDEIEELDERINDEIDVALEKKDSEQQTFEEVDAYEAQYQKMIEDIANQIASPLSEFRKSLNKLAEEANQPSGTTASDVK